MTIARLEHVNIGALLKTLEADWQLVVWHITPHLLELDLQEQKLAKTCLLTEEILGLSLSANRLTAFCPQQRRRGFIAMYLRCNCCTTWAA